MIDDLTCDIYLNWKIDIQSVGYAIAEFLDVKFEKKFQCIHLPNFFIGFRKNDSFDPEKEENIWDNFVYYRYILEVEPSESISENDAAAFIGRLLNFFWENRVNAVANCDYEHLLPKNPLR